MRLAAGRRPDQELYIALPFRPRIDELDCRKVTIADKKVFRT
jgi:hypothetical protein